VSTVSTDLVDRQLGEELGLLLLEGLEVDHLRLEVMVEVLDLAEDLVG